MPDETIRVVTYDLPEVTPATQPLEGGKLPVGGATFLDIEVPDEAETAPSNGRTKHPTSPSISHIPIATLEVEMERLINVVERLVNRSSDRKKYAMQLEEIELSVEIDGRGKVSLVGAGLDMGGKGAIKLKFKRKSLQ
ncbi:MAG: hypothetical protein SWY16_18720 [Cyanobacteriota bacterium]|nr:hypothetical protein [Cyanobacteriota bacterium]